MSTPTHTHAVLLPFGFKPKADGEPIRQVVFGKRPTAAEHIRLLDDSQSDLDTQRGLLFARAAIISFGDNKRAPYLDELLRLKRADRVALMEGYADFLGKSADGRTTESLEDGTLRLAFGLVEDGQTCDLVELCNGSSELDGYQEVELERKHPGDFERSCVLLGHDIARVFHSDGAAAITGPLPLARIKQLDAVDLSALIDAVAERRQLFR